LPHEAFEPAKQRGAAAVRQGVQLHASWLCESRRPWLVLGTVLSGCAFAWAAFVLPWRNDAPLGLLSWALAVTHLCTALAVRWPARLVRAVRLLAITSLGAAPVFVWVITSTSLQMVQMFGALGWGLVAALAAIGWLLLLATVPVALLGLSVTRARHERS
jgi:hypothetical protein